MAGQDRTGLRRIVPAGSRLVAERALLRLRSLVPTRRPRPVPADGRITLPGSYRLDGDFHTDRSTAILVRADDVTLDLGGHAVSCATHLKQATGIWVRSTRRLTVRNGRITGCTIGIAGDNTSEMTVEGVDFTGIRHIGINRGGRLLVVRRCIFADIGGYEVEPYAVGVNGPGDGSLIEHSEFRRLYRQPGAPAGLAGEGVGIVVSSGNRDCVIRRNWFENGAVAEPTSIAIFVAEGASATIDGNVMIDFPFPIGSMSPVAVTGNVMLMRYEVPRASPFQTVAGSRVTGNTMIGFSDPKTDGIEFAGNLSSRLPPQASA